MKHFCVVALLATFLGAPNLSAQSFSYDISLDGLGNGNPAKSFGLAADEHNNRVYVSICGDFMGNNNVVAEIDTVTGTVVNTIQVGNYPEDIALLGDPNLPGMIAGAVTNSSDGTVSIWDLASGVVSHTVQLPDPFFMGSCYPFGITAGGPGFYVSTVDGSGDVHAIDSNTWTYDAGNSLNFSWKSLGRPLMANGNLLIPTTAYTPSWTGAEVGISGVDNAGNIWSQVMALNDGNYIFPSGMDAVELNDGTVLVAGMDLDARLYQLTSNGEIIRSMRLQNGAGAHGLALSNDGTILVACDLAYGWVTFIDMVNWSELAAFQTSSLGLGYMQPNDAVFCNDKVYVSCQGSEEVMVFDNLPSISPGNGYQGNLLINDSTPAPGSTLSLDLSGNGVVALFVSFEDTAGSYSGVALDLGAAPMLAGWSGNGSFSRSFTVPLNAPRGMNLFAQGIIDVTGTPTATAPRCVVIQ